MVRLRVLLHRNLIWKAVTAMQSRYFGFSSCLKNPNRNFDEITMENDNFYFEGRRKRLLSESGEERTESWPIETVLDQWSYAALQYRSQGRFRRLIVLRTSRTVVDWRHRGALIVERRSTPTARKCPSPSVRISLGSG